MVTLVSQGWTACSFWRISCLLAWILQIWVNPYQCHYWKLQLQFYFVWAGTGWVARRGADLRGAACEMGAVVSSHLCGGHHHEQPEHELLMSLSKEKSITGGRWLVVGAKLFWHQIPLTWTHWTCGSAHQCLICWKKKKKSLGALGQLSWSLWGNLGMIPSNALLHALDQPQLHDKHICCCWKFYVEKN